MNIDDFDKYIEKKILARGIIYYESGSVISLEYDEDENTWTAEVEGTDDYSVTVMLAKNGDILDTSCDCPYEFGDHCKHQVAVFYSFRKQLDKETKTDKSKPKKEKILKFEDVIAEIESDELIPFLRSYAKKHKQFKSEFMLTFSNRFFDKSTVFKNAKTLIKSSFVGISRDDYISSSKEANATQGADKVLEMAKQETSLYAAVKLCFIVIEEMLGASSKYCDNNGYFYGMATETVGIIREIFSKFSQDNVEFKSAFEFSISSLPKTVDEFNPYEIHLNIIKIFVPLCTVEYIRHDVEKYLKILGTQISSNNYSSNYYQRSIQQLQHSIISLCDGKAAAIKFAHDHLDNNKFREMIIEHSIEKKDYDKALKLCLEGEKKDVNYQGLLLQWQRMRYRIYEITCDTDGQKNLAYEFTINGDFDYYVKLRKLYSKNTGDWQQVFEKIIQAVTTPYNKDIYTKILIHENMKPELLEYCKKYVVHIPRYYLYLIPDYQHEVDKIFIELLRKQSAEASSRRYYKEVCDLIEKYAKACGVENANNIIRELKLAYPRRPAFLEELGNLSIGTLSG